MNSKLIYAAYEPDYYYDHEVHDYHHNHHADNDNYHGSYLMHPFSSNPLSKTLWTAINTFSPKIVAPKPQPKPVKYIKTCPRPEILPVCRTPRSCPRKTCLKGTFEGTDYSADLMLVAGTPRAVYVGQDSTTNTPVILEYNNLLRQWQARSLDGTVYIYWETEKKCVAEGQDWKTVIPGITELDWEEGECE